MKINANASAGRENGHANTQRTNNWHDVQKASRILRANKAQRANKTQNTVINKVRINAQKLFKTMSVSPAKIFGQTTGTTGNEFVTPPEPTVNQNAGGMGSSYPSRVNS